MGTYPCKHFIGPQDFLNDILANHDLRNKLEVCALVLQGNYVNFNREPMYGYVPATGYPTMKFCKKIFEFCFARPN